MTHQFDPPSGEGRSAFLPRIDTVKVRTGWSGEQPDGTWRKVDVELSESDLEQFCHDNNLDLTVFSNNDRFQFLLLEANRYMFAAVYQATLSAVHLQQVSKATEAIRVTLASFRDRTGA